VLIENGGRHRTECNCPRREVGLTAAPEWRDARFSKG
jgi:hypothetical protein